jgi:hypothetical protein
VSTLSLRLPNSLHERLRALAAREGISINQLVTLAAAEKVASILTVDYLAERARAADLAAFDRLLDRVPATPTAPSDELPAPRSAARAKPRAEQVHEPRAKYGARTPKRARPAPRKGR